MSLTETDYFFFLCMCFLVICPYPNIDSGGNYTISTSYFSYSGNDTSDISSFGHWWSKTNTTPLYLIILLLPLLCLRSASFFARFTFLGNVKTEQQYVEWPTAELKKTKQNILDYLLDFFKYSRKKGTINRRFREPNKTKEYKNKLSIKDRSNQNYK